MQMYWKFHLSVYLNYINNEFINIASISAEAVFLFFLSFQLYSTHGKHINTHLHILNFLIKQST
jgi:hypothetical protein